LYKGRLRDVARLRDLSKNVGFRFGLVGDELL
jgi:hypothetical protein